MYKNDYRKNKFSNGKIFAAVTFCIVFVFYANNIFSQSRRVRDILNQKTENSADAENKLDFEVKNGDFLLDTDKGKWIWKGNDNPVGQVGAILRDSGKYNENATDEEMSHFAKSFYQNESERTETGIYYPVTVKTTGSLTRVSNAGFILAENCRKAKTEFLPLISLETSSLDNKKSTIDLNKIPRCYSSKVNAWNGKIKNIFMMCNSINLLYDKLTNACQIKTVLSQCTDIAGILVKPCAKYSGYFGYFIAGLICISAVLLLIYGFILSASAMFLSGILIVLSGILAGAAAGWVNIFACGLSFVFGIVNAVKGILSFYAGG